MLKNWTYRYLEPLKCKWKKSVQWFGVKHVAWGPEVALQIRVRFNLWYLFAYFTLFIRGVVVILQKQQPLPVSIWHHQKQINTKCLKNNTKLCQAHLQPTIQNMGQPRFYPRFSHGLYHYKRNMGARTSTPNAFQSSPRDAFAKCEMIT